MYSQSTTDQRVSFSHYSQCTSLLSDCLKSTIAEEQKDAIWATAVTLSNLAFSSISVSSHEEAWPLKPFDPSDLQWLRLKASDKALWHIANPMRPGSAFSKIPDAFSNMYHLPARGIDGISSQVANLCGLDKSSTPENSVYFWFAHALSMLFGVPQATLGDVFGVMSIVTKEFRECLEAKDPVALLLLYLWYTRACDCRWWISIRARHELPAIRIYLQRHHGDNEQIQAFLLTEAD